MIYTKHTSEVNQNVFEHFVFASSIGVYLLKSSLFMIFHGITGGIVSSKKHSIEEIIRFLKKSEEQIEARKNVR